jgi:hypothetical protein
MVAHSNIVTAVD